MQTFIGFIKIRLESTQQLHHVIVNNSHLIRRVNIPVKTRNDLNATCYSKDTNGGLPTWNETVTLFLLFADTFLWLLVIALRMRVDAIDTRRVTPKVWRCRTQQVPSFIATCRECHINAVYTTGALPKLCPGFFPSHPTYLSAQVYKVNDYARNCLAIVNALTKRDCSYRELRYTYVMFSLIYLKV